MYIFYCLATRQGTTTPQRRSREYFTFKYQEPTRPPGNWAHFKSSKTIKEWNIIAKDNTAKRTKPDTKMIQSITDAFT